MRTSEGDHSSNRSLDQEEGRSRKAATGTRQPLSRMYFLTLSLRACQGCVDYARVTPVAALLESVTQRQDGWEIWS